MSDYDFVHDESVDLKSVKSLQIGFINLFSLRKFSTTEDDHFEVTVENIPKPLINYEQNKPFYDVLLGVLFFIFMTLVIVGWYIYKNCKNTEIKITTKSVDPYAVQNITKHEYGVLIEVDDQQEERAKQELQKILESEINFDKNLK